jgi:hypothetical protein
MTSRVSRTIVFLIAAAAVAGGGAVAGRAEQTTPASDVLGALLTEVRGLRAAMERMASAGPRVQLALGRLQLQEQRIVNQIRRLDAVKVSVAAAREELKGVEDRAKQLEGVVRDFPNSQNRSEAEMALAQLKGDLARKQAQVQRLTAEETMLEQDIASEQGRWSDFNQRLEALERELGGR